MYKEFPVKGINETPVGESFSVSYHLNMVQFKNSKVSGSTELC